MRVSLSLSDNKDIAKSEFDFQFKIPCLWEIIPCDTIHGDANMCTVWVNSDITILNSYDVFAYIPLGQSTRPNCTFRCNF